MWSRHKIASKLLVALLCGDGVLGKNAIAGNRQLLAANVADLVIIVIGVGICRVSADVLATIRAAGGAIVVKGVTDVVECRAAVFAAGRAGVVSDMPCIGICFAAKTAGLIASIFIIVCKTGGRAAQLAKLAVFFGGLVRHRNGSLFIAEITFAVAFAVIRMGNGLAIYLNGLSAVLANGAARSNSGGARSFSVTGGAALGVAGCIASEGIAVRGNVLSAAFNSAGAVTVEGIAIKAYVIAKRRANIAVIVAILVGVSNRRGCAASTANECVAQTFPNVLLGSFVSAALVIANGIAGIGIRMEVANSLKSAAKAGGAATELKIVQMCSNDSGLAANGAGNGTIECICMLCRAGRTAGAAYAGAGVKEVVGKLGADFAADVTGRVAVIGVGMRGAGSHIAANGANRAAGTCISMYQLGASNAANLTGRIAIVLIGVLGALNFRRAGGANLAVAGFTGVLRRGFSFNGEGAAIAERIAVGRILMIRGAEAGCEREERESHSQK